MYRCMLTISALKRHGGNYLDLEDRVTYIASSSEPGLHRQICFKTKSDQSRVEQKRLDQTHSEQS